MDGSRDVGARDHAAEVHVVVRVLGVRLVEGLGVQLQAPAEGHLPRVIYHIVEIERSRRRGSRSGSRFGGLPGELSPT